MDLFNALAESEKEWTINDIGRNSISEIHNNPNDLNKLKSQKLITYDIPIVPVTSIRKVRKSEFQKYNNGISDEFEKYMDYRVNSLNSPLDSQDHESDGLIEEINENIQSLYIQEGKELNIDVGKIDSSDNGNMKLISVIPEIFFDKDFNLENPMTFEKVCENINLTSNDLADVTSNNILQEKLSYYLDIVEVNLMSEISKKKESFFSALSSLKGLYNEIDDCVDEIRNLKEQLQDVSMTGSKKGLEVVRMKRRRVNLENLYSGIRLVSEVRQTQPTIQILLGQNDYIGALGLIEETSNALRGYSYQQRSYMLNEAFGFNNSSSLSASSPITPTTKALQSPISILSSTALANSNNIVPLDLRGVRGLVNINGQLSEMSKAIEMMMQNEVINQLVIDIITHSESVKNSDNDITLSRQSSSNLSNADSDDRPLITIKTILKENIDFIPDIKDLIVEEEILYTKLSPMIFGLIRVNRLILTMNRFKDEVQKRVSEVLRKKFPYMYEDSSSTTTSSTKSNLLNNSNNNNANASSNNNTNPTTTTTTTSSNSTSATTPTPLNTTSNSSRYENIFEDISVKKIKGLMFEDYYSLLGKYYKYTLNVIRRIAIIKALLIDMVDQAEKKNITMGVLNEDNNQKMGGENEKIKRKMSYNSDMLSKRNLSDNELKFRNNNGSSYSNSSAISTSSNNNSYMFIDYTRIKKDISIVVNQIIDVYYANCSRLLSIRSEKNSQLSSLNFHRLYNIINEFIVASERLTQRTCFSLKSNLLSQAKLYISSFHTKKIKQLASNIELDQWVPAEISKMCQDIVNQIVKKDWDSIVDLESNIESRQLSTNSSLSEISNLEDNAINNSNNDINSNNNSNSNLKKSVSRCIFIDKKKYIVAGCTLLFISILNEYIYCAETIPILVIDILNCTSSLLQVFNSKVCQIIIGGGAVTSAGLRYITAKHLALASRSLGAVNALIPYIKIFFQSRLAEKQLILINDLDRYSKDYTNHQREIYDKLVSIMNGKLETHCKSLRAMNWESPEISTKPNVYMLLLVKDLTSLYRVLGKILPIEILQVIMKEVFNNYTNKLEKELKAIEIYSSNAKNSLLIDFQYFIQKLSFLEGIDGPGNRLEVVINNISIKEKKQLIGQNSIISEYIQGRKSTEITGSRNSNEYSNNTRKASLNEELLLKGIFNINNSPSIAEYDESDNSLSGKIQKNDVNSKENKETSSVDENTSNESISNLNGNTINENINNSRNDKDNNEINNSDIEKTENSNTTDNGEVNQERNNENEININSKKEVLNSNKDIINSSNTSINKNISSDNNSNNQINKDDLINKGNNNNNDSNNNQVTSETNTQNEMNNNTTNNNGIHVSHSEDFKFNDKGSNIYDKANTSTKEENANTGERKSSYTLNKKTFSVLSQNVLKFGNEIKKHYAHGNTSVDSLFSFDTKKSSKNLPRSLSQSQMSKDNSNSSSSLNDTTLD